MTRRFVFRPPPARFAEQPKQAAEPDDWTDADLDTLAVVSADDVKAAESHAQRLGSPLLNELLAAQPVEDDG